jgi:hypothetical protein
MALPDNDGFVGKYLVNTALDQASLWAKYTWYDGPVAGLGIGGGVRYVGESFGDAANTILIPDYTLFDTTISFDFKYLRPDLKGWSAQINATNLANRYYVASCVTSFSYCGLGAARTVLGTIPLLTALLSAIGWYPRSLATEFGIAFPGSCFCFRSCFAVIVCGKPRNERNAGHLLHGAAFDGRCRSALRALEYPPCSSAISSNGPLHRL